MFFSGLDIDIVTTRLLVLTLVVWVFNLNLPRSLLAVALRHVVGQGRRGACGVGASPIEEDSAAAVAQTHALAVSRHNRSRKLAGVGAGGVVRRLKAATAL